MPNNNLQEKQLLFICGCPRSGTTMLWKLLTACPELVLGIERFHDRLEPFSLQTEHFEDARFFSFLEGDSAHVEHARYTEHYAAMRERYAQATFLGDKIPKIYERYADMFRVFPDAKIIYIFRNPLAVASSYKVRLSEKKNWSTTLDARQAVLDWNISLQQTLKWHAMRPGQILILEYETIFKNFLHIERILKSLQLEVKFEFLRKYLALKEENHTLLSVRQSCLTEDETSNLLVNADMDAYRELKEIAQYDLSPDRSVAQEIDEDARHYYGYLEHCDRTHLSGWITDLHHPRARLEISVFVNDQFVARVFANDHRPDLKSMGVHPSGRAGFVYFFEQKNSPLSGDVVTIRIGNREIALANLPFTLTE